MSTHEKTDEKQKSEKEFLTLADKKPSLTRLSGNESMSAKTISTRELSDNLQRTRDGMILMRKKQLYDGIERDRISEGDEDEDFENFGMSVRRKPRRAGTGGVDGSLDDIAKRGRKRGQRGEFDSEEFIHDNLDNQIDLLNQNVKSDVGSKDGTLRSKKLQRGRNNCGSNRSGKQFGQFFDENDKRFTSQNPKKDGPLKARIFIDAFLPSIERNRIFPVFNYRCAEKIDRTRKDFNERNRKRLNNQLLPVSSSTPVQEVEDDSRETSKGQLIHKTEDLRNDEIVLKVKEYQNAGGSKKRDEPRVTERLGDIIETNELEQHGQARKQKTHQKVESQEVVRVHDLQQVKELHKVKEVEETLMLDTNSGDNNRKKVVDNSMVNNANKSIVGENKLETAENVTENAQHETAEHVAQTVPQNQHQPSSAAEENLLQKLLRMLMENEELINFFCEKVITKIAARNDFCGPSCNGICGGLNNPSKGK